MTRAAEQESDPQRLMAVEFRSDWAVVPPLSLYWLFVVGVLLGAGGAVSLIGFALGNSVMSWGWPASLVLALVGGKVMARYERSRLARLKARLPRRCDVDAEK
jgi:hypothetical protein